jgi:hypothetical protein
MSAGGDETGMMRDSPGSVQSFISPAESIPESNGASHLLRRARAQTFPAAGTTFCSREATDCFPSTPLCWLDLFLVDLPPFLAFGENVLSCFLERFINPLALEQIAGLAGSHQVIHAPLAAFGMGMYVIDGQDQPAFEIVMPVQTAVVTFELISPENLYRFFATQVW